MCWTVYIVNTVCTSDCGVNQNWKNNKIQSKILHVSSFKKTQIGLKSSIFQPCDLEIWLMTSKNYRAPLLHYIKLWASSQTPRWIPDKRSIRGKISDFLPCVTLKLNGWPWKTIGILFYVTLSLVHHFKAIGEFKLKLQSGNAQFGQKWAIFCPVWP